MFRKPPPPGLTESINTHVLIPEAAFEAQEEERLREEAARAAEVAEAEIQARSSMSAQPQEVLARKGALKRITPTHVHEFAPNNMRFVDVEAAISAYAAQPIDVDDDRRARNEDLLKKMAAIGDYRKLTMLPTDWKSKLRALGTLFPNFIEVVTYLIAMLALYGRKSGIVYIPPMLLNGPPGIGKTLFLERLAALLGCPMKRVGMHVQQTGAIFAGSEAYWGNSSPSDLTLAVLLGDFGNLIVLADELDKAAGDSHHKVINGLYTLLERESSKH